MVEEELDESIFFLELLNHFNPQFNEVINKNLNEEMNSSQLLYSR